MNWVTRSFFKKVTQTLFAKKNARLIRGCNGLDGLFAAANNLVCEEESHHRVVNNSDYFSTFPRLPARRGFVLRTGSMVFGRGLGTSTIGQPSKPNARRSWSARYFL